MRRDLLPRRGTSRLLLNQRRRFQNEGQSYMKMNIATGRVTAVLTGVLLMSIFGVAIATLVEGFESGRFSGSEATVGDASIKTNYFGIAAPQGIHQVLLTTLNITSDAGY